MSFKEIRVGDYALRFWPSDNGWMCGITPEMMEALEQAEKVESISSLSAFDTAEEALAFRKKLKHPALYGIYGMYQSAEKQLWGVIPLAALEEMWKFNAGDIDA